jgi:hypothetical protein
MKNILIIYPHWPPSNLAGVHRPRLISNFLPDFGWNPIVLTVDEKYYEEKLDYDFLKTVSPQIEVVKVAANPVKNTNRFIGDIGLRAFSQLKEKAIELIRETKIDFVWVPIPSYYTAVVARQVHNATQVPYGIDYIDPWVKPKAAAGKMFSKAWLSNEVAKYLEPYAVKKASLISGVASSYYQPVLDRNFKRKSIQHVGMPYGFDPNDHEILLDNVDLPWEKGINAYVYAGAFLPKSHYFLKGLFSAIKKMKSNQEWNNQDKLYFLGTGTSTEKKVSEYAKEYDIEDIIVEIPNRYPFLQILFFLSQARGVMVLGSIEKHYTASKIFQSILSKRPIFPIFHHESSAVSILGEANADSYLVRYIENVDESVFYNEIDDKFRAYLSGIHWAPNYFALDQYSSKQSAKSLVDVLEKIIK